MGYLAERAQPGTGDRPVVQRLASSSSVGEIFTRAIRKGANAVILVHNRFGDASESPKDVKPDPRSR